MISTTQNGYQLIRNGDEDSTPSKTGSNAGFERFHKWELIRLCKRYHKNIYKLIGQKMILKDRVAELEQENAELKARYLQATDEGTSFAHLKSLERENAGLKARLNAINFLTPELEKESRLKRQKLTKAKELLNEFMRISKASDEDFEHDYSELIGEAEQFIKEIGK